MGIDWTDLVTALGLALVLEGVFYSAAAHKLPPLLRMLSERPPSELRKFGLGALVLGLLIVALARSL
jgi:hypothetical protein